MTTAGLLVLAGCSGAPEPGGAATAADAETAEYAAVEYRQGLMHVMAYKAAAVREMADGSRPVDEAVFAKSASDLSAAAGMIVDGFPSGSGVGEVSISNGLPDIWDNWDDFQAKASALQSAASEVATLAGRGGFAAAQEAASNLGGNCGACHRPYRQR
ncbi:MAG TPA: cytochrome c [Gammaproteobacteria bacterium]